MRSINTINFPIDIDEYVLPYAKAWQMENGDLLALDQALKRFARCLSPRIYRLPARMGFDQALVVPFEEENDVKKATSLDKIVDHGHLHGRTKVLLRKGGKIYTLNTPSVPLEGKESDVCICSYIAAYLNNDSGKERIKEWSGLEGILISGTSINPFFKEEIFNPFIKGQAEKFLKEAGVSQFVLPQTSYIIPNVEHDVDTIETRVKGSLIIFKDYNAATDVFTCAPELFDFKNQKKQIPKLTALGKHVLSVDKKRLIWAIYNRLSAKLYSKRIRVFQNALETFVKDLNQSSVEIARCATESWGRIYNWLESPDALISIHRKQAVEAYPLLMGKLLLNELDTSYPERMRLKQSGEERLIDIVDRGDYPVRYLSNAWELPEKAVRTLVGKTYKDIGGKDLITSGFYTIAKIKDSIEKDWWPDPSGKIPISTQWNNFLIAVSEINIWNFKQDNYWGASRNTRLSTDQLRTLTDAQAFWKVYPHKIQRSFDIQDTVEAFAQQLLLPILIDAYQEAQLPLPNWSDALKQLGEPIGVGMSPIETALVGSKSFKQLLDIADTWHKNYNRMDAELVKATDYRCWPALIGEQKIGEFWAIPLCSAGELADESARMDHCVGNYISRCLTTRCHIISLRDKEGKSISTLEINLYSGNIKDREKIKLVQNQGIRNSDPGPQAVQAGNELLNNLRSGAISINFEEVEESFEIRKKDDGQRITGFDLNIGYETALETGRNTAIRNWSFAIARKYRELTHAEWSKELGLDQAMLCLVAQNAPKQQEEPKLSI